MNNLKTREEFLFEMYSKERVENTEEVNEGLLSNLFGALLKQDMWSKTKGEDAIKNQFKEIDDSLSGFGLTKIKNPNDSQNVRQTLVAWASNLYDLKKKAKDDGVKLKEILDAVAFKDDKDKSKEEIKKERESNDKLKELDKKIEETDKKYQKQLDDFTKDPELKRWSDILKNQMDVLLDKVLAGEFDDEGKFTKDLEEIEKKKSEKLKKLNDEASKEQKEQMQKIAKERNDVLTNCGAKPVGDNVKAKDFLKNVADEITKHDNIFVNPESKNNNISEANSVFDGKSRVDIKGFKETKLTSLLGISQQVVGKNTTSKALFETLSTLNTIILSNVGNDFKKSIDGVGGISMQAALVSYCNLIMSCFGKSTKLDDSFKLCMARCAIFNNTIVGFGLPCPDSMENAKDDDKRSLFAFYVNQTLEAWKKDSKRTEQVKTLEPLCKEILDKAKSLIDDYNKEQEQKLKKEEQEQQKEEK